MIFRAQYQADPPIPGMGLSFLRVNMGGHAVVEHQGVLPGSNSQIFLAPDDDVGVVSFRNGSRNAATWLTPETGQLLGDLIGVPDAVIRAYELQHPETWGDLCGCYRSRAQRTDMQARSLLGTGCEVSSGTGGSCCEPRARSPTSVEARCCNRTMTTIPTSSGSTCPGTAWHRLE